MVNMSLNVENNHEPLFCTVLHWNTRMFQHYKECEPSHPGIWPLDLGLLMTICTSMGKWASWLVVSSLQKG